jgi:hypothetical protein
MCLSALVFQLIFAWDQRHPSNGAQVPQVQCSLFRWGRSAFVGAGATRSANTASAAWEEQAHAASLSVQWQGFHPFSLQVNESMAGWHLAG